MSLSSDCFYANKINRTLNSGSSQEIKKQELSIQNHKNSQLTSQTHLQFDRLQQVEGDQVSAQTKKYEFGQFVAREAVLDEEYWVSVHKFSIGSLVYLSIPWLSCSGICYLVIVADSSMAARRDPLGRFER